MTAPDVTEMLANLHPAEAARLVEQLGDDIALKVIDPAGIPMNVPGPIPGTWCQVIEPHGSVFAVEPTIGRAMIAAGVAEQVHIQAGPDAVDDWAAEQ